VTTEPAEWDRLCHDAAGDLLVHLERRLRSREAATTVLAETVRRASRRSSDLPADPERRRMWWFTIAANVLADHHRSTRRTHSRPEGSAAPTDPERGKADAVSEALRLHTAQRELIMLIDRDGYSIVEAARLLGLDTSTGGSNYAAAREHLRQSLAAAACSEPNRVAPRLGEDAT
jgi:RNA polymerase sigma-70 factor (ECF subfamily)